MISGASGKSRRFENALTKFALVAAMVAMFAVLALFVGGPEALPVLFGAMAVSIVLLPRVAPHMVMLLHGARPMTRGRAAVLRVYLAEIARRAGLEAVPDVYWLPSAAPTAFATGASENAAIAVSEASLRLLTRRELAGVLAHEVAHIANGDGRLTLVIEVVRQTISMTALVGVATILGLLVNVPGVDIPVWLPMMLILGPTLSFLLQRALSRTCEFAADAKAVELTGDPQALAAALYKIESLSRGPWGRIFGGWKAQEVPSLLRSHPDSGERIRRLLEAGAAP